MQVMSEEENGMSEQDDEEDDDLELRRDIAREVEEAFAYVPYPGDDRLVRSPTFWENDEILAAFQGKHWRDLSVQVMFEQRFSQPVISPEAYRFYLPAYLIAGLLHSDETDTLWENVFYEFTPPSSSQSDQMERFHACIAPLSAHQKAVVRRYVELYVQIEGSLEDPGNDRALLFWQRLTDLERAEGADERDHATAIRNIQRAMGWESKISEQEAREAADLEQEIAREVEEAFATVPYPGDDKITNSPPEWEKALGVAVFHGKHWRNISLDVLSNHRHSLKFFSSEAFHFFLPSYLIASVIHAGETGELRDQLFYNLMPPREQGHLMDSFLARIHALDARQKAVVRRFMELWSKTATCYPDTIKERGLSFWRQVTDTPSAAGSPSGN